MTRDEQTVAKGYLKAATQLISTQRKLGMLSEKQLNSASGEKTRATLSNAESAIGPAEIAMRELLAQKATKQAA